MAKKTPKQWAVWFLILNAGLIATAAGISLLKRPTISPWAAHRASP